MQQIICTQLLYVMLQLVKEGKVKLSEVPYMQRGGAWDDSDLVKKVSILVLCYII
jgi:hypothetical protein